MTVDQARLVADAVLYEGYLLYPYRATSGKNQVRWQFGVLAPEGAAAAGLGEESGLAMQTLLSPGRAPRCRSRCGACSCRHAVSSRPAPTAGSPRSASSWSTGRAG
ncbi:hypothetical protein [Pseudonocardia sp. T1-2H]|uniref:hypothetical protein n=1 Tax=Pseudonocardia sp. T1-2H TaxID=3128899 RepID=UPI00310122A4